jgi:hypothetical protein
LPDVIYFQTKNPNWVFFVGSSNGSCWKYFIDIWSILQPFGIVSGNLVYFVVIWYRFGMLYHEKSGNPARAAKIGPILRVRSTEILKFQIGLILSVHLNMIEIGIPGYPSD